MLKTRNGCRIVYLIRISFGAYEDLFHQAIRLDDIHGIRNFLVSSKKEERLLSLFKAKFHQKIGALFCSNQKLVTKKAWPLIPGSTLYGAVATAPIRLDCRQERADEEACRACFNQGNNTWNFCPPQPASRLGLLTPAILLPEATPFGSLGGINIREVENFRLRRYTCWRTGLYWEATELKSYGGPAVKDHLSQARLGLAEDAIIHLQEPDPHAVQDLFLHGLGASDFSYLGWGQVYFQE